MRARPKRARRARSACELTTYSASFCFNLRQGVDQAGCAEATGTDDGVAFGDADHAAWACAVGYGGYGYVRMARATPAQLWATGSSPSP